MTDRRADFRRIAQQQIEEAAKTTRLLARQSDRIAKFALVIVDSLERGGKLILFGKGGSAADSQHIAAEFVGRYNMERRPLPAIALTTNTSALTAIGNDFGYGDVFKRQVDAICRPDDVVVGISTSGVSENVILGVKSAKKLGAYTVGMTGLNGGKLARMVDLSIRAPSDSTPRVQECHILIGHIVSGLVEDVFARRNRK